ncbi:MAG: DUF362 domain-containing protein [Bacteroides sp.]|nr:DUF362 domain-containing protein [Bacteroides sp.]MCM1085626.1 DUF362 domain-containing protein [Bacteroides sp.]
MKKLIFLMLAMTVSLAASAQSKVFMTREISPEALVRIYQALGRSADGHKVAVKISTGEAGNPNYLQPALIGQLVDSVHGTIVECNTAYAGKRNTTEAHWQTIREHGFDKIAPVDLMDEEGQIKIPVKDRKHIRHDLVGSHLNRYDYMINLAHFKGHAMGGYGGVLKNASIGVASADGKAYIHSAGKTDKAEEIWENIAPQDDFLESMAAAAQAVHDYFGENIVYINVMNNMSVDCDCAAHPSEVLLKDYGILASTDPVALDKACVDIIFHMKASEGNDNAPLIERINSRHGTHTIDHAAKIGLGSLEYEIIDLDK